jgi:DNA-binding GntR family transcriptional regulator
MSHDGPIELTNASTAVYNRLRTMIFRGTLKPGQVITLRSVGAQLGVSTTPIREALRMLQADGMVKYDRRAITVAALSPEEVAELFEIRLRLEQLAAERAISRVTDDDLADIEDILERLDEASYDQDRWRMLNQDFHRRFYDCADSAHLSEFIGRIWASLEPYMAIYASAFHDFTHSSVEHHAIYDAIKARDLDSLLNLTEEHLDGTLARVLAQLDDAASKPT